MRRPHASPGAPLPPLRTSVTRTLLRLAVIGGAGYGLFRLLDLLMRQTSALQPGDAWMQVSLIAVLLSAYALLIAVPFVPGVEIGLAMIAMGGSSLAPLVYLATVAGLLAAYCAGRWLPERLLTRVLLDLRLARLAALIDRIRPLSPEARLAALQRWLPPRVRFLVGWRYVLLALLINLPGSIAIGGGGGICLMCGITRLFRPSATAVTVALAVLPLPLGVWLWWPGLMPR